MPATGFDGKSGLRAKMRFARKIYLALQRCGANTLWQTGQLSVLRGSNCARRRFFGLIGMVCKRTNKYELVT
jgi:hypothetical protein